MAESLPAKFRGVSQQLIQLLQHPLNASLHIAPAYRHLFRVAALEGRASGRNHTPQAGMNFSGSHTINLSHYNHHLRLGGEFIRGDRPGNASHKSTGKLILSRWAESCILRIRQGKSGL
jgi:hypothetical protein